MVVLETTLLVVLLVIASLYSITAVLYVAIRMSQSWYQMPGLVAELTRVRTLTILAWSTVWLYFVYIWVSRAASSANWVVLCVSPGMTALFYYFMFVGAADAGRMKGQRLFANAWLAVKIRIPLSLISLSALFFEREWLWGHAKRVVNTMMCWF